ncbi:DUF4276 family protein [Chryseobacterium vrystaatense]|uniref:DUF4276 domain-containing protein n=1 Tax=Chryseobacterium vrystaatense TaxID=307480 RepID=A0A1M5AUT5_9FLAO|nr:DUF4276 family protein [Chryseobacterium vrystaatense]SHF33983.1 protein of unknown function [Chryseobacterium vrystaatense]
MSYQLFLGYTFEGTTDKTFLKSIIERTISNILCLYSNKDVEIVLIPFKKDGEGFVEQSINSIRKGYIDNSTDIFYIHSDSDDSTNSTVIKYKFEPLYKEVSEIDEIKGCNIIPIIPVYMTESWLLADFDLLKKEISTNKTKAQLNLTGNPEEFTDPKLKIIEALRTTNSELPKKRRKDLNISDLYQIIGQKIEINKLMSLASFKEFYINTFEVLKQLNLIDYHINV